MATTAPAVDLAPQVSHDPWWLKAIKSFVKLVSLGLPILLAAAGALGIQGSSDYPSETVSIFFHGIYMIFFAATLFIFEIVIMFPGNKVDMVFRRNLGFMYGPIGRGLYTLV